MEHAVVGLVGPVVLPAAGVVAELHRDLGPRARGHQHRPQRRPSARTRHVNLRLVAAADHVEVEVRAMRALGSAGGQEGLARLAARAPRRRRPRGPACASYGVVTHRSATASSMPRPTRCRRRRDRSARRGHPGGRSAPRRRSRGPRPRVPGHAATRLTPCRLAPALAVNENVCSNVAPAIGCHADAPRPVDNPRAGLRAAGRAGGAPVHARAGERLDRRPGSLRHRAPRWMTAAAARATACARDDAGDDRARARREGPAQRADAVTTDAWHG